MKSSYRGSSKNALVRKPIAVVIALVVTGFSYQSAWAVVDAPVRDAMEAIHAQQPQKAFDLLLPLEATRAGDPDFDSALGIAANDVGQFARAIFALERVLVVQPSNGRARAELARAFFAVGDSVNARLLLQETKSQGVPEAVGRTIDDFLQAIDKVSETGRPAIKAHVETGIGYDSNVNSGPSNTSFAVPFLNNAVVQLLPGGIKTGASYLQLNAGVSGRALLAPRWSFIGNANLSSRKHQNKANPYDIDQIDVSGGATYREERHEFSGVVSLGHTAIGGSTLRKLSGLTGEWTYRPDGKRQWSTYVQLANLDYPSQSVRDAHRTVLGTSYAFQATDGTFYYAGSYFGQELTNNSAFSHLSHRILGARAGLQKSLNRQWSVFTTLSLEDRDYKAPDLLFLKKRQDLQVDLSLGATWLVTDQWRITPQINVNRSQSNLPVNDSSKYSFSLTGRYEF